MLPVMLSFFSTLGDILSTLLEEVLVPVLQVVFETMFNMLTDLLQTLFADIWLELMVIILKILDFLEGIFDIFSGVRYVLYYPNGVSDYSQTWPLLVDQIKYSSRDHFETVAANTLTNYKQTYLIDLFTRDYEPLRNAFLLLTAVGVFLAFMFTIYKVARSAGDMALEEKKSVGQVLTSGMKSALTFLLVPALVLFFCKLSTILIYQIDNNLGSAGKASAADMLFIMATLGDDSGDGTPSFDDGKRSPYLTGSSNYYDKDGKGQYVAKSNFNHAKFDYFTTMLCAVGVILMMVLSIFVVIKRLIEAAVLYIISPLFVSTIPLDDGERFGKWRNRFIGCIFSGFGTVVAMKLFLMIVPIICSSKLHLSDSSDVDMVIRVFIILGGVYAAYKSTELVLQVLDPEAAQSNALLGMAAVAMATGAAGGVARMFGGSLAAGARTGAGKSRAKNAQQLNSGGQSGGAAQSQAFTGGGGPGAMKM